MRRFWLICSILIISLSVFYIFQVNALAYGLALIEEGGRESNKLKTENEKLQVKFMETCSLENLETLVQDLNFEKVTEVSYIKALETWVAVK